MVLYDHKVLKDINPKAPFHYLLIPLKHSKTHTPTDWTNLNAAIAQLVKKFNLSSYRIMINVNSPLQEIDHAHTHVLSWDSL